ncbi:uncharacterized protein LOC114527732 [Dendronephthya gigantea]|uniref:uncharacterized protein LOC114527732 n=1 Tax=Dendronephthya gigantea TaxID=151771 RepID=UPI00106B57EC|nr:uncharacterized protein LOC114527732 [Dendronephthya gigantea]
MADVEAMFHQVRVRPPDCDSLRFLWWPDNDLSNEPAEYQMMVHLFGSVSSPTCANFALRQTADDNSEQFDNETVNTVKRNFYVDNCLKSSENEQAAITTAEQLRLLLSKGGFRLTKWLSNSRRVNRVNSRIRKIQIGKGNSSRRAAYRTRPRSVMGFTIRHIRIRNHGQGQTVYKTRNLICRVICV